MGTVRSHRGQSVASAANLTANGYDPSANGLLLATDDPETTNSANTFASGVVVLRRIPVTKAVTVATLWYLLDSPATAATAGQCFVGLYGNIAGSTVNLLGKSADQATAYATSFIARSAALTQQAGQSLALPAGSACWAAFLFNGTTSPQLVRTGSKSVGTNLNRTGAALRAMVVGSGLTDLPATLDLSTGAVTSSFWAGLS